MINIGNSSADSGSGSTSRARHPLKPASRQDLESHREKIQRLYQQHKLEDVQKLMKNEEGIYATISQYRKALRTWKEKKYVSKGEKLQLIGILRKNEKEGNPTSFRRKTKPYAIAQLTRYIHEKKLDDRFLDGLESRDGELPEGFEAVVAAQVQDIPILASNASPYSRLPASPQTEPRRREDLLSLQGEILRDHEQFPEQEEEHEEQGATAEIITPASIWESYLRAGLTSGGASPEARTDLQSRARRLYEKHFGNEPYDFNKISDLTESLWLSNRFTDAEELDQINIELAEQSLGPSHLCTLHLKGSLACVLSEQGRYAEAEKLELDVVKSLELQLGEDDELTLRSKTNLGYTYLEEGRLTEARDIFSNVSQRAGAVLGAEHDLTLSANQNLGKTWSLLYRYNDAERILRMVASERERSLGFLNAKTLKSYNILASALQAAGNLAESGDLIKRISCAIASANHPRTLLWTLEFVDNQARQLRRHRQLAEAEGLLCEILYEKKTLYSERHPTTLGSKALLADALHGQFKTREAIALGQEVFRTCEETFGAHNRNTLVARSNLAWYQAHCLKLTAFRSEVETVLKLRKDNLGETDPDTLNSYMDVAYVYSKIGCWRNYKELFARLQETQRKMYGTEKHPEFIGGLKEYGVILDKNGEYSKAEEVKRQALNLARDYYGSKHPETLKLVPPLAYTLTRLYRIEEAEVVLSEGISGLESTLGYDHPLIISLLGEQAFLRATEKKWAEAEILERRIAAFWEGYGSKHPHAILAKSRVARSCVKQHKFLEAEQLYSTALRDARDTFGPRHCEVANILIGVAGLQREKGNLREALALYDDSLKMKRSILGNLDLVDVQNVVDNFSGMSVRSGLSESQELHLKTRTLHGRISLPNSKETLDIIVRIARLHTKKGQWNEAERLYKIVLETQSILLREDHETCLQTFAELAMVYAGRGNFSASKELLENVLAKRIELLGDTHPATLRSMSELAGYHARRKEWAAVEAIDKYVLAGYQKRFGDSHIETIRAMEILASTLKWRYQCEDSDILYQKILGLKMSRFGENHLETAYTIRNIAKLRRCQQRFPDAEEHFRHALQILDKARAPYEAVISVICDLANSYEAQGRDEDAEAERDKGYHLGAEHLDSTNTTFQLVKKDLARSRIRRGKHEEAEDIIKELLELEVSRSGHAGSDVLELEAMLGDVFLRQGKFQDCEKRIENAIGLWQEAYGRESPEIIPIEDLLALAKRVMGKLPEAETLQRSLLDKKLRIYGENSLEVEESLEELMSIMAENRNIIEAERFGQRALDIRKSLSLESSASAIQLKMHVAGLMQCNEKHLEAEQLLEEAYLMQAKSANASSHDMSGLLLDLAAMKLFLGKFSEAEELLLRAIDLEKRALGDGLGDFFFFRDRQCCEYDAEDERRCVVTPRHTPDRDKDPRPIYRMFNLLIDTKMSSGELENAETLQTEVFEAMKSGGCTECKHYWRSMHRLIDILCESGKYDEAEDLCYQAILEAKRVFGEGHSLVLRGTLQLARTKGLSGQLAEAESLHEYSIQIARQSANRDVNLYLDALGDLIAVKAWVEKWDDCAQFVLELAFATIMSPRNDLARVIACISPALTVEKKTLLKTMVQRADNVSGVFGSNSMWASSAVEKALTALDYAE